jgi:glycine/D-amino acid oxidase-like deaminating enzyme
MEKDFDIPHFSWNKNYVAHFEREGKNYLRIVGIGELTFDNTFDDSKRMKHFFHTTKKMFPYLKLENASLWACLRPVSPDNLPYIGIIIKINIIYYYEFLKRSSYRKCLC